MRHHLCLNVVVVHLLEFDYLMLLPKFHSVVFSVFQVCCKLDRVVSQDLLDETSPSWSSRQRWSGMNVGKWGFGVVFLFPGVTESSLFSLTFGLRRAPDG